MPRILVTGAGGGVGGGGRAAQNKDGVAEEYARALGKQVEYLDVPSHDWMQVVSRAGLPEHVQEHLVTMARLHRDNRYGRVTRTVEQLTGQPAQSVEAFVASHAHVFGAGQRRDARRCRTHVGRVA